MRCCLVVFVLWPLLCLVVGGGLLFGFVACCFVLIVVHFSAGRILGAWKMSTHFFDMESWTHSYCAGSIHPPVTKELGDAVLLTALSPAEHFDNPPLPKK